MATRTPNGFNSPARASLKASSAFDAAYAVSGEQAIFPATELILTIATVPALPHVAAPSSMGSSSTEINVIAQPLDGRKAVRNGLVRIDIHRQNRDRQAFTRGSFTEFWRARGIAHRGIDSVACPANF
jgi:hypothetical protein